MSDKLTYESFVEGLPKGTRFGKLQCQLLQMLSDFEPGLTEEAKIFLAMLLIFQSEGHTRIPLDAGKVKAAWEGNELENLGEELSTAVSVAIEEIKAGNYKQITGSPDSAAPFLVAQGFLYPNKYYQAKRTIEAKVSQLFVPKNLEPDEKETKKIAAEVSVATSGKLKLEPEQASAIARGAVENLMITGGPGTGKTTVVFFLLRNLYLQNAELLNAPLYLAAPSGKAADRMRESIANARAGVSESEHAEIYGKIAGADSFTLHRLLGYNPQKAEFVHNADHQFAENSVFVVDESSMIDIVLFSKFLEALPASARVFLLGDKDQLPSVEAGAVLGDLLAEKKGSVVTLTKSRRFSADSRIGQLAELGVASFAAMEQFSFAASEAFGLALTEEAALFEVKSRKAAEILPARNALLEAWCKAHYSNFLKLASFICSARDESQELPEAVFASCRSLIPEWQGASSKTELDLRNYVWSFTLSAKILSAERSGFFGVRDLNLKVEEILRGGAQGGEYFAGQILMFTENQTLYKLFNGDTGVVTLLRGVPQLMLRRGETFKFYTLACFAKDSHESAFAITIHKSQGSEYGNVLAFLPNASRSPLLNRQILYTGITRAKRKFALVASKEAFEAARTTLIRRDTGIEL